MTLAGAGWRFAAHLGIAAPDAPLLTATAGSIDPVDQIACAASLGFAGITDNGLKMRPAAVQRRMGEALRAHGMEMGSFTHNMLGHDAPFFWGAEIRDMPAALSGGLAAASRVGKGCINAILLDSGAAREDQLARAADNLAAAAELAVAEGVRFAVEGVSRARVPAALIEGAADVARIVRATGSGQVGLILDSCHCHCAGEDMAALILAHADILAGVQVADMPGRIEPGSGDIDFAPIMAALRTIGWDGLVEAEFTPSIAGAAGERAAVDALGAMNGMR